MRVFTTQMNDMAWAHCNTFVAAKLAGLAVAYQHHGVVASSTVFSWDTGGSIVGGNAVSSFFCQLHWHQWLSLWSVRFLMASSDFGAPGLLVSYSLEVSIPRCVLLASSSSSSFLLRFSESPEASLVVFLLHVLSDKVQAVKHLMITICQFDSITWAFVHQLCSDVSGSIAGPTQLFKPS